MPYFPKVRERMKRATKKIADSNQSERIILEKIQTEGALLVESFISQSTQK